MRKPWDRGGLRTYLVLVALVLARPDQVAALWGVPFLACGLLLHVYAKGSLKQNQVVARGGPYRFVRHPFYLANLFVDEGIAVMSGSPVLMALLPVWWLAVYVPVMRGEERYLSGLFPEVYPAYRRQVPMLLPFRRPLPSQEPGFSWRNANIVADTVIPRALRIAALPLLFVLYRAFRAYGMATFDASHAHISLATTLTVLAYGLAWELTRHLKRRRRILPPALARPIVRAALACAVVAAAGAVHAWEMEAELTLPLVGACMMGLSVVLRTRHSVAALAAEGIVAAGATVLCEILWLAPIPLLFYSALLLDRRLNRTDRLSTTADGSFDCDPIPAHAYSFIMAAVVLSAAAKELLT